MLATLNAPMAERALSSCVPPSVLQSMTLKILPKFTPERVFKDTTTVLVLPRTIVSAAER